MSIESSRRSQAVQELRRCVYCNKMPLKHSTPLRLCPAKSGLWLETTYKRKGEIK